MKNDSTQSMAQQIVAMPYIKIENCFILLDDFNDVILPLA